jgi:integrase
VPIPPELVEPLRRHFASQNAEQQAAGDAWDNRDLVWCGPEGRPIDPHDNWEEWKALLAESGITKDARLHDARHTAGTLLGEQHVDMHVIQRILGHAQVATTRIYTEPTDPLTREAAGLIGKALWPDGDQPQPNCNPKPEADGAKGENLQFRPSGASGARTRNPRIKSPLLYH